MSQTVVSIPPYVDVIEPYVGTGKWDPTDKTIIDAVLRHVDAASWYHLPSKSYVVVFDSENRKRLRITPSRIISDMDYHRVGDTVFEIWPPEAVGHIYRSFRHADGTISGDWREGAVVAYTYVELRSRKGQPHTGVRKEEPRANICPDCQMVKSKTGACFC
jgi:uncharacterized radical SAM superfamily Fe-S cluster-containing enzyme